VKIFLFIVIPYFLFLIPGHAQSWLWGKYGIGDGTAQDISIDSKGNCYLSGLIPNDTIHFGSYTFINPPYNNYFDAFLIKYNAKGNVIWAKQWFNKDTSLHHSTFSPATTAASNNGNVYLNGNFSDTLVVGTYTMVTKNGFQSTCIAKYDSNGNLKWVRTSRNSVNSNSTGAVGNSISRDNFGNVFLLGAGSYDTVYFGSSKIYYHQNVNFNDFLVKYDSAGNVKWAKQAVPHDANSSCVSFCVKADALGNIYTTGNFADTIQLGTDSLKENLGDVDFQIVKRDSSGNVLWVKQGQPANMQPAGATGISIATDNYGNAYACGQFFGSFLIGQDTIKQPPNYQDNFFVVKYSSNGNVIWVKQATILDGNPWDAWSITSDNNNIYVSGSGGGSDTCKIVFGGDTLTLKQTNPTQACFLFKLDSSGKATCGTIMQQGISNLTSVAADTSGKHVYFSASFSTEAIFGPDTINPNSYPINHIQGYNYFPIVARWQACDSNIFQAVPEVQKPLNEVVVYPNPNNGSFTVEYNLSQGQVGVLSIYNLLGQKINDYTLDVASSKMNITDNVLNNGMYVYVIMLDGRIAKRDKLIIIK